MNGLILGHPNANTNVREAALALEEAGLLAEFHVGLDTTALARRVPRSLRSELERRAFDPRLARAIRTHPIPEAMRLALERQRVIRTDMRNGYFSIRRRAEAVDAAVERRLRTGGFAGVYLYEDGAATSFAAAHALGLARIYDLPIGYWRESRRILSEEAELAPAWASTISALREAPEKLERKDREIALASRIICASSFTRRTLASAPGGESLDITVVPYGVPEPNRAPRAPSTGRLRVLYVGGLSQRKGLSYFFEAVRALEGAVDVTVVGRPSDPENDVLRRALMQVKHIDSLPLTQVLALMRDHDVLVLPSLFEGFGLVLAEAMSQGTPFIATDHTAGPELIGGLTGEAAPGWIVPIRDSHAIAARLALLADDADAREASREAALSRAAQLPWHAHRAALGATVTEVFSAA
ncbi:glycosyltransferase family 4 protein [Demequina mangrovi]|uniref:Glycosyl transferases group 1 n=1 Tax=Demequina mangrovi TaxID=1043493 RepID=A0A1H6YVR5_9MICO|nr:glycosyltransferase family 4 protein [Demequina mangrovi]SEJ40895.1 Glycosyl transferases group 1 [Demequina mangrovi]